MSNNLLADLNQLISTLPPVRDAPVWNEAIACHPITRYQLEASLPSPTPPFTVDRFGGIPVYTHPKLEEGRVWMGNRSMILAMVHSLGPWPRRRTPGIRQTVRRVRRDDRGRKIAELVCGHTITTRTAWPGKVRWCPTCSQAATP